MTDRQPDVNRNMMWVVGQGCLLLLLVFHLTAGNMPPVITCPDSFEVFVKKGESTAKVTWDIPTATDDEGVLTPKIDKFSKARGSTFEKGVHLIKYRVYDKGGRKDTCTFTVTVSGADCPPLSGIPHGSSSCRTGSVYGQTCHVTCEPGYEVLGDNSVTCNQERRYSKVPGCEELTFYTRICRNMETSSPSNVISEVSTNLDQLQSRLQAFGSLSTYRTIPRATELCSNDDFASHGACVFLKRYNLTNGVLFKDLAKIKVNKSNRRQDNIPQYSYRQVLLTHPEMSFCKNPSFLNQLFNNFPDVGRFRDVSYQADFRKTVESFHINNTAELRAEASRICGKKDTGPQCLLRDIFDLMDRAQLFLSKVDALGRWLDEDINHFFNALTFNSVILKWNYQDAVGAIQPQSIDKQQDTISQILRAVSLYIDDGEDDKLRTVVAMFPEVITDKICNNGKMCLFWRVIDQTRLYVHSRQPSASTGVKVRVLNTQMDYREFLQQKQMERILQLLADQEYNLVAVAQDLKDDFKKSLNQRFHELKTYFKKVHSFSAAKAKADLVEIDIIRNLATTANSVAKDVDTNIILILTAVMTSAGAEVVGKTAKLTMTIAANCNPLKAITDFDPASIYDAASELANAVANLASGVRLVAAVTTLNRQGSKLSKGFDKNKNLISNMKLIMDAVSHKKPMREFEDAKDEFLKLYTDFYPAVSKPQLVEMGSYFRSVVDKACSIIEGSTTLEAAVVKGIVGGSGLCWTTQVKIDKMMSAYESIYDKQFDLIAILADNVRSQVALEAADGIVADYDAVAESNAESENVLQKLQQVAGMSYVSYRIMVIQVIRLYCDELEYKSGGVRPDVCKDSGTDISTLLSYTPPTCSSRNLEFYTAPSRGRNHKDRSFIDFTKLYQGKEVDFKIRNNRWLLRNGWITKADFHSSIFVSGFEVYLPSDLQHRKQVRVEVYAHGENELTPGGTRYKIIPEKPMVFEYKIGHGTNCRQSLGYDNPYTTCSDNKIPEICPNSEYSCFLEVGSRALLPSIFSNFRIRVMGFEDEDIPNPATPLPLKIALRTCTFIPDRAKQRFYSQFQHQGKKIKPSTCCSDGQYWSTRLMECQNCPSNTTVALRGYYCERD